MSSKLENHKIKKGIAIAPLNQLPISKCSWSQDRLPEYLWLGLILMNFPRTRGLKILYDILKEISDQVHDLVTPKLSLLFALSEKQQNTIYQIICKFVDKKILTPLTAIYRDEKHETFNRYFYIKELKIVDRLKQLSQAIKLYDNHYSNEATDLRFCILMLLILKKNIIFNPQLSDTIESIINYSHTSHESEKMRQYRSLIRVMELGISGETTETTFITHFWKEISMKTTCEPVWVKYEEEKLDNYLINIDKCITCLNYLINSYKEKLIFDHKFDVIVGSATYIFKIFNEIIIHKLGHSVIGRNALRTAIEVYIMLRFLIKQEKDNPDIWEKYKRYGIGKYKDVYLKNNESNEIDKTIHYNVDVLHFILNEDQWEEFVNIEYKYFEGNIKDKFKDVGEEQLYSAFYDYNTNFIHGFWGAIRESCMCKCQNAAHQYHLIPDTNFETNLTSIYGSINIITDKVFDTLSEIYIIPEKLL